MSRPNENLRETLDRERGGGREAFRARIRAARGKRFTELQDDECGERFTASGPTVAGPGEFVTTIRVRDNRGRPVPRAVQILPDQAIGEGGAAAFVDVRRSEVDSVPVLTAADPEVLTPGETTPVLFVGTGLSEDPLDVITAVRETDITVDDPRVAVSAVAWVPDPQSFGVAEGLQAISGDVTVSPDAVTGSRIFYSVERL